MKNVVIKKSVKDTQKALSTVNKIIKSDKSEGSIGGIIFRKIKSTLILM